MRITQTVIVLAILLADTMATAAPRYAHGAEPEAAKERRYSMMYAGPWEPPKQGPWEPPKPGPWEPPKQSTDPVYLRNALEAFVRANLAVVLARSGPERKKLQQARLFAFKSLIEAELAGDQDPSPWIRRLTDSLVSGQTVSESEVLLELLGSLQDELRAANNLGLVAYVEFREIGVRHRAVREKPGADVAGQRAAYLKNLSDFVDRYPTSADSAEALTTIALAAENAGDTASAIEWYARLRDEFHKSRRGALAAGAIFRLTSVGQPVSFRFKDIRQQPVDSAKLRGRYVVLHFWSADSQPSIDALEQLSALARNWATASCG